MKRLSSILVMSILPGSIASVAHAEDAEVPVQRPGRPASSFIEVGLFGGAIFPAAQHNFQDETTPHQSFQSVAPEVGARIAYVPLPFVAGELEGAVAPTKTEDGGAAGLWAVRAHALGQLPLERVTPFVLFGFGRMGAGSNAMGSDSDPTVHFGAGAKLALDDFLGARLDLRDNLSQKNQSSRGAQVHHPEVLAGLTFTLDLRKKPEPPPPDTDADGVIDPDDACPKEPGLAAEDPKQNGCPPPPDRDEDGIIDAKDACPDVAGVPDDDPAKNGCSVPKDSDGDGVLDADDRCPNEAGDTPEGCSDPDPDKDGILAPDDRCPEAAETRNGFEDADGCPDELPEAMRKLSGVLAGVDFDLGKASLRPASKPVLDEVAKVLSEYPELRVEISVHTDNLGSREANVLLSTKRAEAIQTYLVAKGVEAARITPRGAGPDEPIADNATREGQKQNRRVQLRVVSPQSGTSQ